MAFQPLDTEIVIDPFTVTSLTNLYSTTAIYLDADPSQSSLLLQTSNTSAIYVDKYQNVGINTVSPTAQLDINSADGRCVRLTYNSTSNTADLRVTSNGNLLLSPSGSNVVVDNNKNLLVQSHNGSSAGLWLGDTLVLATASQLNYSMVIPGTASASKALVLDASSAIAGISSLSATSLTGTLQTASQPNVTSVSTLDVTGHHDNAGLALNGELVTATAEQLNYTNVTPGTASASRALVLGSNSSVAGITSLSATSLTGTLQTAAQPNITSVGTLSSLDLSGQLTGLTRLSLGTSLSDRALVVNGITGSCLRLYYDADAVTTKYADLLLTSDGNLNITTIGGGVNITTHDGENNGLYLQGTLVLATAAQINYLAGTSLGIASAGKALIVDGNRSIGEINSLTANAVYGTIQTAAQPNISSVSALNVTTHDGSTVGFSLGSVLVQATAAQLNYTNVTPGTATASKALVLDSNASIAGITSLSATSLTGALQTAAQPNITSVGTLTSITTSGDLTVGATAISEAEIGVLDDVVPGTAAASKALVLDASSDIDGINSLTATTLTGTLQTAAQPNITSVTTLDITSVAGGLKLAGTDVTSTATQLNYVNTTPGTAGITSALVLDANKSITGITSLSATNLTGTLQTAAQPNVTSVGTLSAISTSGSLTMGSTVVTSAEMGVLQSVTPGVVSASKTLVVDENKNLSTINNLTVANLTGTSVDVTSLTGTLQTASQPNVTSVTTLDITGHDGTTQGLRLNGDLLTATAAQINSIFGGSGGGSGAFTNLTVNESLTLAGADGTSEGLVLGSTLVTSSGTELNYLTGSTPGTAAASTAVILDANKSIAGITSVSATNLTGTLQTAAQPNITSVGTLTSINTSGSLTMGSTTVSEGEIGVLDGVVPGTAAVSKALVLDASSDIAGINSLSASSITSTAGSFTMGATTISESEIGALDAVVPGTAAASKALVLDASSDISGINALSASSFTSTAGSLTMGDTTVSESEIGVLDAVTPGTAAASKALVLDASGDIVGIDSLSASSLTSTAGSLTMNGVVISSSEIGVLDSVTPGTAAVSKALVLDANKDISGIHALSTDSITSTAGSLTMGATTISASEIGVLDAVTPGIVTPDKAVVADSNKDISAFRNLEAVTLSALGGTLTMGATDVLESDALKIVGITDGAASASKALVLDPSKDISGIGSLSASSLTSTAGSLTMGATAISESEIGVLDGVTPGTASVSKALVLDSSGDVAGIDSLSASSLTSTAGSLTMGATVISESEIGVLDAVTPGTVAASKAVVVDANKDIASFRNLTATNLTGTLQTAAQPNITSVGTLSSLNVENNITTTAGDLVVGTTTVTADNLGWLASATPGTATASTALVTDITNDIDGINALSASSVTATTLTGTIQTAAQPNITSVTTLDVTGHNGTTGLKLGNVLLTATAAQLNALVDGSSDSTFVDATVTQDLILSGHNGTDHGLTLGSTLVTATAEELNYTDTTAGHAEASKALVLDSSKYIDGIAKLTATQLYGAIETASQPGITSVTTLNVTGHDGLTTGLQLGGDLLTATAAQINSIFGTEDNDGTFPSLTISGANGVDAGLTLGSTLVTASGTELNYLSESTPGTATVSSALVTDANKDIVGINSLSATLVTGTLQTAAQPNITSVGTLTSLALASLGGLTMGSTVISESEIGVLDGVTAGTVAASKAVVVDANKDIGNFRNLTATNLTGTLQTAAQPNITSVGTLTSLMTTGDIDCGGNLMIGGTIISESEIIHLDSAIAGTASANKAMVTDVDNSIAGINSLSATTLTGTLQTAAQPNVTSVGTLTSLTTTGDIDCGGNLTIGGTIISESEIIHLDSAVAGTASANKAMVTDTNNSIAGINSLSATTLTGTLQTASQPNVTSVTTLQITGHDGAAAGLTLGEVLITASGTELNYVDTTAGTAQASKALVLGADSGISGIGSMGVTSLTATGATDSTSVSTGAIITAGGAGIAKSLFVGGDLSVAGALDLSGSVALSDTTESTSETTGSFTTAGGVGIAKSLYVGLAATVTGSLHVIGGSTRDGLDAITNTTDSTATTNGSLITAGGVGIAKALTVGTTASIGGNLTTNGTTTMTGAASIINTTDSTSTSTGSLTTAGGVGIAKALYVGTSADIGANLAVTGTSTLTGDVSVVSTQDATSSVTGSLVAAGGVGIAKSLYVAGVANITNSTASTSTSTGALVVAGGAGIVGAANIGGAMNVGGAASVVGDVSTAGMVLMPAVATGALYKITAESDYTHNATGAGYEWYTGATPTDVGTKIMQLDSSGLVINNKENITDVTDSTSAITGSFTTAGGVGIVKSAYIGANANIGANAAVGGTLAVTGTSTLTGAVAVNSVTDSTSVSTGSVVTAGGMGVAKSLYVGTDLNTAGNAVVGGTTTLTGSASVISATDSTSVSTGSVVTAGGMGVAKSLYVGANIHAANDLTVLGTSYITGGISTTNAADSTSITTGSMVVAGGAGISKSMFVGENASIAGDLTVGGTMTQTGVFAITNVTNSSNTETGALVIDGGVGIAKSLHVGGVAAIVNATASVNAATGALVVAGGVGVSGDMNVGGNVGVTGDIDLLGNLNLSGTIVSSDLTLSSDANSPFSTTPLTTIGNIQTILSTNHTAGIGYDLVSSSYLIPAGLATSNTMVYVADETGSAWSTFGLVGAALTTYNADYTGYSIAVKQLTINQTTNTVWVAASFYTTGASIAMMISGTVAGGLTTLYPIGTESAVDDVTCSKFTYADDAHVLALRYEGAASGQSSLYYMNTNVDSTFGLIETGAFATVAWCGGFNKFIATRTGTSSMYVSTDIGAGTWVDATTPTSVAPTSVCYNSTFNRAVAVGPTYIWYSTNGTSWTTATFQPMYPGDTFNLMVNSPTTGTIAVYGNINNSILQMYYTSNGINWTTITVNETLGHSTVTPTSYAIDANKYVYALSYYEGSNVIQRMGPIDSTSMIFGMATSSGYTVNKSAVGYKWYNGSSLSTIGTELLQLDSASGFVLQTKEHVANVTESTSSSTGAFTTAGGVGIAKSLHVGGSIIAEGGFTVSGATTQTGILTIDNTTDSVSTSTGAITTLGGIGLAKALNVGTTATIGGALTVTGASTLTDAVNVLSTTDSTSSTTGSIKTAGGVGIAKALYVGTTAAIAGNLTVSGSTQTQGVSVLSTTDASSTSTGSLTTAGGVGIAQSLYVGGATNVAGALTVTGATSQVGVLSISNATDTTSTMSGSLVTSGGVGIAKSLEVGYNVAVGNALAVTGTSTFMSTVSVQSTTASTSSSTGSLTVGGGVGIADDIYIGGLASIGETLAVGGVLTITNTTDASSISTGSLITYGGVGITKKLYVGDGIYGTLQTAAQPNITSVGTLNITAADGGSMGLSLGGALVTSTATELNYLHGVTPGTAVSGKALVLSGTDIAGIGALSASTLTGTLQTAAQPNITSVATLNITSHNGVDAGLALGGDMLTVTAAQLNSLIAGTSSTTFSSATVTGNLTLSGANGSSVGLVVGSTLVTSSGAQLNYVNVTPGTATATKALVLDSSSDVSGIHSLSADMLTGTLQTTSQPNIESVTKLDITGADGGTLGLSLGGILVTATAAQINYTNVTPGAATASKALVLDASKNITGITGISATSVTGTLQTAAQPNITSVGTLTSITTSGSLTINGVTVTSTDADKIVGITDGTAAADKALVVDSARSIANINNAAMTTIRVGAPANNALPAEIGFVTYTLNSQFAYSNSQNAHGITDVGEGTAANYSLRTDGRIICQGEIDISSDRRLKKDIVELTLEHSKQFVMTTTPVKFNWKDTSDTKTEYGYIAQEILKAGFNNLVNVVPQPGLEGSIDEDGFINPAEHKFVLAPGKIIPLLALNQREVFSQLAEKDRKIADLETRLAAIEAMLAKLV